MLDEFENTHLTKCVSVAPCPVLFAFFGLYFWSGLCHATSGPTPLLLDKRKELREAVADLSKVDQERCFRAAKRTSKPSAGCPSLGTSFGFLGANEVSLGNFVGGPRDSVSRETT